MKNDELTIQTIQTTKPLQPTPTPTMKKSILARAFRGVLGTNDPEEESAVELVRKIVGA
jgi:hypothetical protein